MKNNQCPWSFDEVKKMLEDEGITVNDMGDYREGIRR